MRKRSVAILIAIAAILVATSTGLSAGSSSSTARKAAAKPLNLWFVDGFAFVPAWLKMERQFKHRAAQLGDKATVVGLQKLDPAAMVSAMDQAIANKADAILTCNIDPKVFTSEIKKARRAGIVVVTIGCVDKISNYSIGTDNLAYGRFAADLVGKKLKGKAQVGFDGSNRSAPNQVLQVRGFKARAAAKYPGIKVVAWEEGKGDAATDARVITAMVQANPGLNAIVCISSTCPAGAQAGLSAAGKKPGDVFFVGIDAEKPTLAAIKTGWVSETLAQCWFDAAPFAVDLMHAKLTGHGSKKQSWAMPVQVVTSKQLPYKGCPAKLLPKLKTG
jgi:ABC-type sugar transport system substrate-binding protein